jgi:hypothetical protein
VVQDFPLTTTTKSSSDDPHKIYKQDSLLGHKELNMEAAISLIEKPESQDTPCSKRKDELSSMEDWRIVHLLRMEMETDEEEQLSKKTTVLMETSLLPTMTIPVTVRLCEVTKNEVTKQTKNIM